MGTMVRMFRNPGIATVAAHAGLDFIMLDLEHGSYSMQTVGDVFAVGRALALGCFVRVPELSKGWVSRTMDAGANGIMVPMLESVEQARQFVAWAKYPPRGKRGFGGAGGHTEHRVVTADATPGFMERANEETVTIAQIETAEAISAIDAIAAVPGIDALLIGPNDLAISLGCAGDLLGDEVDRAVVQVAEAAKKHGKIFGMHAPDALIERWIPKGCSLIMSNLDVGILTAGMKAIARRYKT